MIKLILSRLTVALLAVFTVSTSALAQNVIVIDSVKIRQDSQVGQHINRQLKSIQSSMTSELKALGTPIESEAKSLAAQMKDMNRETLKGRPDLTKRIGENQKKMAKFQYEEQMKARELQVTEAKASAVVGNKIKDILRTLAAEKGANVVIDRSAAIYYNPSADVTQTVISRLNSQMATTPVNRERLPRR